MVIFHSYVSLPEGISGQLPALPYIYSTTEDPEYILIAVQEIKSAHHALYQVTRATHPSVCDLTW